jgi:hypothetical protein
MDLLGLGVVVTGEVVDAAGGVGGRRVRCGWFHRA